MNNQQPYKFAVTSTIFQHAVPLPRSAEAGIEEYTQTGPAAGETGKIGRIGMNSSAGAYWNNEKDGMWNYKYEAEKKGFDVVITVIWISIV